MTNKVEFTEEEIELFAQNILRSTEIFEAAVKTAEKICGEYSTQSGAKALLYAKVLFSSDELQARLKELREDGSDMEGLPSKAEYARNLWALATDKGLDADTRHKYMRLYGEAMEYVGPKNSTTINNNNKQELPANPLYHVVKE